MGEKERGRWGEEEKTTNNPAYASLTCLRTFGRQADGQAITNAQFPANRISPSSDVFRIGNWSWVCPFNGAKC